MPPESVLTGLLLLLSFCASHCSVIVPSLNWKEPALLWAIICMPTGSGKSPLYGFLVELISNVRSCVHNCPHPAWLLDDVSYEKMGDLMSGNDGRMLAMYDELTSFLSQLNIYRGKGIIESHDLSSFLSLYNAKSWNRATGKCIFIVHIHTGI